mmetsp:Transcript_99214/g.179195  ORF Transcript_99214/g.179195 Transcript_99214/m.179195 type:complete len:221 (-) Transcript_99214:43-705(-)
MIVTCGGTGTASSRPKKELTSTSDLVMCLQRVSDKIATPAKLNMAATRTMLKGVVETWMPPKLIILVKSTAPSIWMAIFSGPGKFTTKGTFISSATSSAASVAKSARMMSRVFPAKAAESPGFIRSRVSIIGIWFLFSAMASCSSSATSQGKPINSPPNDRTLLSYFPAPKAKVNTWTLWPRLAIPSASSSIGFMWPDSALATIATFKATCAIAIKRRLE